MICCACQGIEDIFGKKKAARELKKYRSKGAVGTTRMLIEAIQREGVAARDLLDIGGGIGAIQHELLKAGVKSTTGVEASTAYIEVAGEEAERQGHADRVCFHHGDFVALAPKIEEAEIVTMDRVICCYPDMDRLLSLSLDRAGRLYGLVYPRDSWWMGVMIPIVNFGLWALGKRFRTYLHASREVEKRVLERGFTRRYYARTFMWQVVVYGK